MTDEQLHAMRVENARLREAVIKHMWELRARTRTRHALWAYRPMRELCAALGYDYYSFECHGELRPAVAPPHPEDHRSLTDKEKLWTA